jgi:hypothetical protein
LAKQRKGGTHRSALDEIAAVDRKYALDVLRLADHVNGRVQDAKRGDIAVRAGAVSEKSQRIMPEFQEISQ